MEVDSGTYEVGQNVNVTSAWYIQYDSYSIPRNMQHNEAAISLLRGGVYLSSDQWLNETDGYHAHESRLLLNPGVWNPGQAGENGVAECSLAMYTDGGNPLGPTPWGRASGWYRQGRVAP